MKDTRKRTRKCVLLSSLIFSSATAIDHRHGHLRRQRRRELGQHAKENSQKEDLKLERIWQLTKAEADAEYERLLTGMSMPTSSPVTSSPVQPNSTPQPTQSPTTSGDCLEGTTREIYLFDILKTVTDTELLTDPGTPQGLAFDHIANNDLALADICASSTSRIRQRYGLTTFYYSLEGENWSDSEGWLSGNDECTWFGIECHEDDNSIKFLRIKENNLVGNLPPELKVFERTERIILFANSIFGTIPEEISKLTNLLLFDVEQNLLTGQALPEFLLKLTSLEAYRVSSNFLGGSIPTGIGALSDLEQLWLGDCPLTGTIPSELASMASLKYAFLYNSESQGALIGPLPSELGRLANLLDFRVYGNQLRDTVPTELFEITTLETLHLGHNFLSGNIPTEIGGLSNLSSLGLERNLFTGTIPTEIGFLVHLEDFTIYSNFLDGSIPNSFEGYGRLEYFDVSNNFLGGSIPETIFEVPTLEFLYLSNNTLNGPIPSTYSKAPMLIDLYIDGNELVGTIPPIEAGDLEDLNEFVLHGNFLSGSVPSSICDLRGDAGDLDDLFVDCGGENPKVECDFPTCCNRCFED